MITLLTLFVPKCSVWKENFFQGTGVVHRITYSVSYFLLTYCFIHSFVLDIKGVLYPVKQLNYFLVK